MSFTYISKRGVIEFPSEHNIENSKGKYVVNFYMAINPCGHLPCYFMVIKDGEKEKKYGTMQIECLEDFARKFCELKECKSVI